MYLLDTNIILRLLSDRPGLSESITSFIDSHREELYISLISAWEIGIKRSLGKLFIEEDPIKYLINQGIASITLELKDVDTLLSLPDNHRDPFDRLLVSQAIRRNWSVITTDKIFQQYTDNVVLA